MVLMPPPTPKFVDLARDILVKEGISGLYAGVASPALGAMAHKASMFLSYGIAKQVVSVLFRPYKREGWLSVPYDTHLFDQCVQFVICIAAFLG